MMETTTVKGEWWLPDAPNQKLAGDVTYGPMAQTELSLFNYFVPQPHRHSFVLHGLTASGLPVTLFNCWTQSLRAHLRGVQVATIRSDFAVIGGHFEDPLSLSFASLYIDITHLYSWVGKTGIKAITETEQSLWRVTHQQLPDIQLGCIGDLTLSLVFAGRLSPTD